MCFFNLYIFFQIIHPFQHPYASVPARPQGLPIWASRPSAPLPSCPKSSSVFLIKQKENCRQAPGRNEEHIRIHPQGLRYHFPRIPRRLSGQH